jgi:hypothetical protein
MTLLDVGCGWGANMRRAVEKYDVNVIGLTLSKNQAAQVQRSFDAMDNPRTKRVLLEGWEQFDEPVDRIVSIGAFEHFGHDRYQDFFTMAYGALPADGVMLLHTIVGFNPVHAKELGIPLTFDPGPVHQVHHDGDRGCLTTEPLRSATSNVAAIPASCRTRPETRRTPSVLDQVFIAVCGWVSSMSARVQREARRCGPSGTSRPTNRSITTSNFAEIPDWVMRSVANIDRPHARPRN